MRPKLVPPQALQSGGGTTVSGQTQKVAVGMASPTTMRAPHHVSEELCAACVEGQGTCKCPKEGIMPHGPKFLPSEVLAGPPHIEGIPSEARMQFQEPSIASMISGGGGELPSLVAATPSAVPSFPELIGRAVGFMQPGVLQPQVTIPGMTVSIQPAGPFLRGIAAPFLRAPGMTMTQAEKDRIQTKIELMINREYSRYCISPTEAKTIAKDYTDVLTDAQLKWQDEGLSDFNKTRTPEYEEAVGKLKEKARKAQEAKGAQGNGELWKKYGEARDLLHDIRKIRDSHPVNTGLVNAEVAQNKIDNLQAQRAKETDQKKRDDLDKKIKDTENERDGWVKSVDQRVAKDKATDKVAEITGLEREVEKIKNGKGTDQEKAEKAKPLVEKIRALTPKSK